MPPLSLQASQSTGHKLCGSVVQEKNSPIDYRCHLDCTTLCGTRSPRMPNLFGMTRRTSNHGGKAYLLTGQCKVMDSGKPTPKATEAYSPQSVMTYRGGRGGAEQQRPGPCWTTSPPSVPAPECTWGGTRVVGDSPAIAPNPLTCTRSCSLARSHSEHVPRHVSTVDPRPPTYNPITRCWSGGSMS